jgi:DNA-binding Xre family transcriptional regulator
MAIIRLDVMLALRKAKAKDLAAFIDFQPGDLLSYGRRLSFAQRAL